MTDKRGAVVCCVPKASDAFLAFMAQCMADAEAQREGERHPLIFDVEDGLSVGIARLEDGGALFLGPVRTEGAAGRLSARDEDLRYVLSTAPVLSCHQFAKVFATALEILTQETYSAEDIIAVNAASAQFGPEIDEGIAKELFSVREHEEFHTSMAYEQIALSAIERGDEESLIRFIKMPMQGQVGRMSDDPLQQEKFLFITMVALSVRAAICGGVEEDVARTIADVYCRRCDALDNGTDIMALAYKMGLHFCRKVAESMDAPNYTPTVQKCVAYISRNLHKNISLSELAELTGFSRHTVSKKFREETGYAITDYINRKKIEEATHLLRHTNLSISDIANYMQYCTQSYFTKVFREIVGVTPRQYRESRGMPA
ncbi:MAG: AraC family transcriptional regulator [Clostridiales Family XIII bacterium]|nr:AraC family transcriptional regulator [Clostridiales Family XIII bacterium]